MLPIFLFWVGAGSVEMDIKGSSLRLLSFLLCKSCIIGRCFRCDVMQIPNFTWHSDFRDGQETLMGIRISHAGVTSPYPETWKIFTTEKPNEVVLLL